MLCKFYIIWIYKNSRYLGRTENILV